MEVIQDDRFDTPLNLAASALLAINDAVFVLKSVNYMLHNTSYRYRC